MEKSRIFWTEDPPDSGSSASKTVVLHPESRPPVRARDLFEKHYERLREWWESTDRAGLSLLAMDREAVRGGAFLAAKPDSVASAILGRHPHADLRLPDPTLSLRHLAVLLYPREQAGRIRYRLLDLRTASAFIDERGKRLRALETDGPAFVWCGGYLLAFFPFEAAPRSFPTAPERAWESVPERLYLDEVEAEERSREWEVDSDRAWEADALPKLKEPATLVHSLAGPKMAVHELLEEGDRVLGELRIASPRGVAKVTLGRSAARAGVLLGRSRRCDAGRVLSDRSISRVHLLLIELAGRLYAIDTASYNGTWSGDEQERVTRLEPGLPLSLGDFATVTWTPAADGPVGGSAARAAEA